MKSVIFKYEKLMTAFCVMLVIVVSMETNVWAGTKGVGNDLLYYEIGLNQRVKKDVPSVIQFDVANTGKVHIILTFPEDISSGVKYQLYRKTPKKSVLVKSGRICEEDTVLDEHKNQLYIVDWDLPLGYGKDKTIGHYEMKFIFKTDTRFSYRTESYQILLGEQWRIEKGTTTKLSIDNYEGKVCWKTSDKKIADISKKRILKGKRLGNCEVIAILENGVQIEVPLRVDSGHISFDKGELTWY